MSADNYIAVRKINGFWYVWMDFASDDDPAPDFTEARCFRKKRKALAYAVKWMEREAVVEYGIRILEPLS